MKRLRILALAGVLAGGLATNAIATELRLGAMPLNTWWYVWAGAIASQVGTNDNKTQSAFSNVATASWAWMGEHDIYKGKKHQDIRGLVGGITPLWVVAMLREDYIKQTGNDTLEKALKDPNLRIIMKPPGSSVPPVARVVLETHGTSIDTFKKEGRLIQVDASQTTSMLRDGRADLYFESAPRGHPAV